MTPMRILFVDDERRVLDGLRRMLFTLAREWSMTFVESGQEALQHLASEACDVIVTDMRMPGMDGAQLLERVHREHPGLIRIVLSGHTQLEAALRALPIAHQFLSKPCRPDDLKAVLALARRLRERLNNPALDALVSENGQLPARPRLYDEVVAILADPDAAIVEAAEVIERDVGLTTRLLHVVNSAFFGVRQSVSSVRAAVVRLGSRAVESLVLSAEVFDDSLRLPSPAPDVTQLYVRASAVASLAREMAPDRATGDALFLAGMMHEMGLLMMARVIPDDLAAIFRSAIDGGVPVEVVERERLGVTHADLGACILDWWGFSYEISAAVANHLDESAQNTEVGAILRTAHRIVDTVNPLIPSARPHPEPGADRWTERAATLLGEAA